VGGGLTIRNIKFDAIDSTVNIDKDFDLGNFCS